MSITWNTGLAAERARPKIKAGATPKRIKKLHETWARRNGYREGATSSKRQATSGALKKTRF